MEARRRRFRGNVVGRAITLDLIDAVERDVEAIAPLILDDGNFDRALAEENLLHAAIDSDAVLEMDDIISGLESGQACQGAAGRIPPRPAEAPLAAENLVIGEYAETRELVARRNDEPAIQDPDRQTRRRNPVV